MRKRLFDIDRLKGLAILFVVLGHVADRGTKGVTEWYIDFAVLIYQFHMPLFMFLSGLVFYYTYINISNINEYKNYVIKKIYRIIPAFVIFSLLIFIGKLLASSSMYVENIDYNNLFQTYFILYLKPTESFTGSYWYIYVLLEYLLLFPLLLKVSKNNLLPWLGIGIIIFFLPMSNYFALNMFARNFIFFALGIFMMQHYDIYKETLKKNKLVFILLFLFSFILMQYIPLDISRFFIGLFSIFALHSLILSSIFSNSTLLIILGKYSFIIYLMNTIFIGLFKAILIKLNSPFFIIFFISVLAGLYLPVFTKKYLLKKIKYLDQITN